MNKGTSRTVYRFVFAYKIQMCMSVCVKRECPIQVIVMTISSLLVESWKDSLGLNDILMIFFI